jgi:hypothetical protein
MPLHGIRGRMRVIAGCMVMGGMIEPFGLRHLRGSGPLVMAGPGTMCRCRERPDGLGPHEHAQHEDRGLPGHAPGSEHLVQAHSRHGILFGTACPASPDKAARSRHFLPRLARTQAGSHSLKMVPRHLSSCAPPSARIARRIVNHRAGRSWGPGQALPRAPPPAHKARQPKSAMRRPMPSRPRSAPRTDDDRGDCAPLPEKRCASTRYFIRLISA